MIIFVGDGSVWRTHGAFRHPLRRLEQPQQVLLASFLCNHLTIIELGSRYQITSMLKGLWQLASMASQSRSFLT